MNDIMQDYLDNRILPDDVNRIDLTIDTLRCRLAIHLFANDGRRYEFYREYKNRPSIFDLNQIASVYGCKYIRSEQIGFQVMYVYKRNQYGS